MPGMQTLVIVDDHPWFRASARALLEAEGFVVVGEAADARSAAGVVARLRPMVVLVDIGLPDVDGFTLSERLLALPATARPDAVVLTSSREVGAYQQQLARSPAAGFIPKDELSGPRLRALVPHGSRAGAPSLVEPSA
jgi:DNA-binding NarL/FixJ family response regulator